MKGNKVKKIMTFSTGKDDRGLVRSIRKYAKDKDMSVSAAIRSILRKRLSRAGYEV